MGILLVVLEVIEFKYFIRDIPTSLLVFTLALIFTVLGVWLGYQFRSKKEIPGQHLDAGEVEKRLEILQITSREYEVLQLIVKGFSNQQIADALHISLSTVKTHISRIFSKMDVQRRTQLARKARELQIIQ